MMDSSATTAICCCGHRLTTAAQGRCCSSYRCCCRCMRCPSCPCRAASVLAAHTCFLSPLHAVSLCLAALCVAGLRCLSCGHLPLLPFVSARSHRHAATYCSWVLPSCRRALLPIAPPLLCLPITRAPCSAAVPILFVPMFLLQVVSVRAVECFVPVAAVAPSRALLGLGVHRPCSLHALSLLRVSASLATVRLLWP